MSVADVIEINMRLEDKAMRTYIEKHNQFIKQINELNLDEATPVQIAKNEYLYAQAQLYAFQIAGKYRQLQKYYEAMAEQHQANSYEDARTGGELKNSTDAQYLSRRAKGKQLELAARYEGDYIRWNGIANAYENAINSLKDINKAIQREGG